MIHQRKQGWVSII